MTHHAHDSNRRPRMAIGALLFVAAALALSDTPAAWSTFYINLWPDGRVPYRFADAADTDWWGDAAVPVPGPGAGTLQQKWRDEMDSWEAAMRSLRGFLVVVARNWMALRHHRAMLEAIGQRRTRSGAIRG